MTKTTKSLKVRATRTGSVAQARGKWQGLVEAAGQTWSVGLFRKQSDAREVARSCAREVGLSIGRFLAEAAKVEVQAELDAALSSLTASVDPDADLVRYASPSVGEPYRQVPALPPRSSSPETLDELERVPAEASPSEGVVPALFRDLALDVEAAEEFGEEDGLGGLAPRVEAVASSWRADLGPSGHGVVSEEWAAAYLAAYWACRLRWLRTR